MSENPSAPKDDDAVGPSTTKFGKYFKIYRALAYDEEQLHKAKHAPKKKVKLNQFEEEVREKREKYLSKIVDLAKLSQDPSLLDVYGMEPLHITSQRMDDSSEIPLSRPLKDWKIYRFKHLGDLVVIENPFSRQEQEHWIKRCCVDYLNPQNNNNVTNVQKKAVYAKMVGQEGGDLFDERMFELADQNTATDPHKAVLHHDHQASLWDKYVRYHLLPKKSSERDLKDCRTYLKDLRWSSLGYQYEWHHKKYTVQSKYPFPASLARLCAFMSDLAGYKNYNAETAIINYYGPNSTLRGHQDHSEFCYEPPLISFSFGCSAVFLIGSDSKQTKPTPIYIRSGDVLIMRNASRLFFHGVPKILPEHDNTSGWDFKNEFVADPNAPLKRSLLVDYLKTHRVNLNVRQIFPNKNKHHQHHQHQHCACQQLKKFAECPLTSKHHPSYQFLDVIKPPPPPS